MNPQILFKTPVTIVLGVLLAMSVACQRSETSPSSSAQEQLDAMDTRRPVPLLPMMANHQKENMRDHLLVIQEIVQALSLGDFAAVEESASRITYNEKQQQMCAHMGAGADGFSDLGINFHRSADVIIEAARTKDVAATLKAVGNTMARCTSCHEQYRQDIVDQIEWQQLTGTEMKGSGPSH